MVRSILHLLAIEKLPLQIMCTWLIPIQTWQKLNTYLVIKASQSQCNSIAYTFKSGIKHNNFIILINLLLSVVTHIPFGLCTYFHLSLSEEFHVLAQTPNELTFTAIWSFTISWHSDNNMWLLSYVTTFHAIFVM